MKISSFITEKHLLNQIRLDIDAALASVGQKYGIDLRAGNMSVAHESCNVKLVMTTKGANNETETQEAKDFKAQAVLFGVKASDLGKEIEIRGRKFTLTGLKPKSRKAPFVGKEVGKNGSFKLPADLVQRALGYTPQPNFM